MNPGLSQGQVTSLLPVPRELSGRQAVIVNPDVYACERFLKDFLVWSISTYLGKTFSNCRRLS